jgi:type I restriction enzyme S subunit
VNNIEKLIEELCPDGVQYLDLQEVFDLRGGYTPSKAILEFWSNGSVPWFRMEDLRKNGRILSDSIQKVSLSAAKHGRLFEADSILIATTATIGEHALVTVPFLANQQFTVLTPKPEIKTKLMPKFSFYVGFSLSRYCLENTNVSGFASVEMSKFRKFQFPLPPLRVQQEIVSILDRFRKLEEELKAELKAELESRSMQYEHYRNKFLTFKERKG